MSAIPHSTISGIQLYVLDSQDHEVNSFSFVDSDEIYKANKPAPGGIYDLHMGTTDYEVDCESCLHSRKDCPGHPGVLYLNVPVVSPMYVKAIGHWLKVVCHNCGSSLISKDKIPNVKREKILMEAAKNVRMTNTTTKQNIECSVCKAPHYNVTNKLSDPTIFLIDKTLNVDREKRGKFKKHEREQILPHTIYSIFDKITPETVKLFGKPPLTSHPRKFILHNLRVPPVTIRPEVRKITGGRSTSDDITVLFKSIIEYNNKIPRNLTSENIDEYISYINQLNRIVYHMIMGSGTGKSGVSIVSTANRPFTGILQRLPRKSGRIRKNLLGRRAKKMARSVITCNPTMKIDEIGMPLSIAKNIQIPEVVRDYNYDRVMRYFMNGTKTYPGCTKIKKVSTGGEHRIDKIRNSFKLEIGDIIYRDIIDGDIVNFNRQPSLEPSSISSMRVIVMPEKDTIRMNVESCVLFNADFDGDAMNILFALHVRTRNEIADLSSPKQFFMAYKNSLPKIGSVQDSIIGISELTRTGVEIDKYHAMQIFTNTPVIPDFSQKSHDYIFSGRELFTMLLKGKNININFQRQPKIYDESQAKYINYHPQDINVIIDRGELKSGIIDKNAVGGDKSGNIFHIVHNQYGAQTALDLCYDIQQLAINYLWNHSTSMTLRDMILKPSSIAGIHELDRAIVQESILISTQLREGKIIPPIGQTVNEFYEEQQMVLLSRGHDKYRKFIFNSIDTEANNLYKLINTGARGKEFSMFHITSAIGQIQINGERVKENFAGRSLPYFTKFDLDPTSRGYIANSYMSGINNPGEFVCLAQETRAGLITKALSTSETGNYNRMAIKNLEGNIIDPQRKVVDGIKVLQFLYGGDGIDPRRLERVKIPTMNPKLTNVQFKELYHREDAEFEQLLRDRQLYRNVMNYFEFNSTQIYSDTINSPVNLKRIIENITYDFRDNLQEISPKEYPIALEKVQNLCNTITYCLTNRYQEAAKVQLPKHLLYSTTMVCILIRGYLNLAELVRRKISIPLLEIIIENVKNTYSQSLIPYGMAMGIIAAQSISEPMTQNMLDQHHFSGSGAGKSKGMTRIEEILSARPTEKMKSPSMTLKVLPQFRKDKAKVLEIANHIEMLILRNFITMYHLIADGYGPPSNERFLDDAELIQEFEKYNLAKPPTDLLNFCLRIQLDKEKIIEKQLKMETIYHKLREQFPHLYIVYSNDNAKKLVLRIFVRNSYIKSESDLESELVNLFNQILDTIVRGVRGIHAAYISEKAENVETEDGSLKPEQVYYISTIGTNLRELLKNPYLDKYSITTNSITENNEIFGIEATREKIMSELLIYIPGAAIRHYLMYASEMCFTGSITALDRYGNATRASSFMLRISDFHPTLVLQESAINGSYDNLNNVSSNIMLGINPQIGDLYTKFILDEEKITELNNEKEKILREI